MVVARFLAKRLPDKRDGRRIRHSQRRLARTLLLLAGQGRREHSDATALRDDPALRLATGDRAGTAPLGKGGRLPSQPTLSRRVAAWSAKEGVEVLREGLQRLAGWRLKAMGGWRRPKTLVIDIDSLPVEVHGEQPGSAWNGYYHRRVYHPIVAAAGETGDILDLRLREGQVHTADGGLEFVLEVLERAERHLCGKAAVRFDAGYPGEPLMAALEERGTHYVARVRNNAVLKRLALPAMDAVVWDALSNGAPAGEPRTWVCESSYRAGSWSRSRRVVQVVVERPGELIPRCFWLLTSMPSGEMSGEDLLALYRKRGKAEGHLGELMSVVAPALSSTSRRKSHYRGKEIRKREKGVDAFACNQVRLLLAGFGWGWGCDVGGQRSRSGGKEPSGGVFGAAGDAIDGLKGRSLVQGCTGPVSAGWRRSGAAGAYPGNRAWTRANAAAEGCAESMATLTRRTETMTRAPILRSLSRSVPAVARASRVP